MCALDMILSLNNDNLLIYLLAYLLIVSYSIRGSSQLHEIASLAAVAWEQGELPLMP